MRTITKYTTVADYGWAQYYMMSTRLDRGLCACVLITVEGYRCTVLRYPFHELTCTSPTESDSAYTIKSKTTDEESGYSEVGVISSGLPPQPTLLQYFIEKYKELGTPVPHFYFVLQNALFWQQNLRISLAEASNLPNTHFKIFLLPLFFLEHRVSISAYFGGKMYIIIYYIINKTYSKENSVN